MNRSHAAPEAGFSLIEALVALALGAVVMAAVLGTVRTGADLATRFVRSGQQDEALSRLADLITGDVQHAIGLSVTHDGALLLGDGQSLRFAMLPRPQIGDSDPEPVLITYRVATGTPMRLTRSEAPLDKGQPRVATVWEIDRPLRFVYLDGRNRWQSQWRTPAIAPRAVGLAVGAGQGDAPQIAAAFLPLLPIACAGGATSASGCALTGGGP
jgi:prepilin-type N-terminal cleavage/methylation domain-containing protein